MNQTLRNMQFLSSTIFAAFLFAFSLAVSAQDGRIHPFTEQMYTQWQSKLDATEAVSTLR